MKCKECPANSEGTCLIKRKSRMLVSGSYGCDAQKKNVKKRLGIYKQTNADKIRHMTDDELAKKLYETSWKVALYPRDIDTEGDWLDWLQQEVEE